MTMLREIFWLLACIIGIPLWCFSFPLKGLVIPPQIIVVLVVGLGYFFLQFINKIRLQRSYGSSSGVFYLYWTIFFAPLDFSCLEPNLLDYKTALVWFLGGVIVYILIPVKKLSKPKYFSSEAVGSEDDLLGMKESAVNNAQTLIKTRKHVSVFTLEGEAGYGKSSFVRMMIESLEPKDFLYMYISLTETNDSKDFSCLFTERWFETLDNRYPRLLDDRDSNIALLSDILREHPQYAFFSSIFAKFKKIDHPIFQTKAKICDPFVLAEKYVSYKISKMFGGIPSLKEKSWVIVIDDLERSPTDEIYRVIEIIERFKIEGRLGLPIPLVFVLCFSESKLKELLNIDEKNKNNDLSFLITQFLFIDSTKAVDYPIPLPPASREGLTKSATENLKGYGS